MMGTESTQYVFSTTNTVRYRFPTHTNALVLDRADAEGTEAFLVVLEPGEAPPLHSHPDTEQIFYLLQGSGTLEIGIGTPQNFPVKPGDLVRIPRSTRHRIRCEGSLPLTYLSIDCFIGGRPSAEPTWDMHARKMCADHGWDFHQVLQPRRCEE
jgi:mannose-6-phosphate isomerase-like protein (cupin superfamily)